MNLPDSERLPIQALSRVFSDMSESYKIFWFGAILDIIKSGRDSASYNEIIDHMIKDAWYMVSEYHLNLGPSDALEKLILYTQKRSGLKSSAKAEDILEYLKTCNDPILARYKRVLSLNVPYRFQAPFMQDFKGAAWNRSANIINRVNRDLSLIYHIGSESGLSRTINFLKDWQEYLHINQAIVSGWLEYNLILYLQKRNPSVPGISNKLAAPSERNLEKAKKFWKAIIEYQSVPNIYAFDGSKMTVNDVSIDHFVPWSYVAHDELWNLVPTTKRLNSSKNNDLPNWDIFFPQLCEIEYLSYKSIWKSGHIRRLFESCRCEHVNSNEAWNKLYVSGIERNKFCKHLEELVLPTYTAAKNLGFREWNV